MVDRRQAEIERIRAEYVRRASTIPGDCYLPTDPANLFITQERTRIVFRLLRQEQLLPLGGRRLLEIGCGTGNWLAEFEGAGIKRKDLAAIELSPERASIAQARFSALRDERGNLVFEGADIRGGDASNLPWADGSFDIVLQSTVFTSILDADMRRDVAAEMMRVTRPGGVVLWYDFFVNNPWNKAVRGVRASEIRALFKGWSVRLHRVTLAPPLARRIVPISWTAAYVMSRIAFLTTHYVGVIRPPAKRTDGA